MTVAQLIEKLEQFPPLADVIVECDADWWFVVDVRRDDDAAAIIFASNHEAYSR